MKQCLILCLLFAVAIPPCCAQTAVVRDIKSFGAKGDGRADDGAAFARAAAFFNARGGGGTLVISTGTYLVGAQTARAGGGAEGAAVLRFSGVRNFKIEGKPDARLRYRRGLRYGSFHPATGAARKDVQGATADRAWAVDAGYCLYLKGCRDVRISGLELDGASAGLVLGGNFGDVGRQLPHYGLFLEDCTGITVSKVRVHHFALDGISVGNHSTAPSFILLQDCTFEDNGRQGLSWIGGTGLQAERCTFLRSGRGKISSPPGAGVDIEAEWAPIRTGAFRGCTFADNAGCALVADNGNSGYCTFDDCIFWGVTSWSVWVRKPGFLFQNCRIYGSAVHGYDAPDAAGATRFVGCRFEDKSYNGRAVYGTYLFESNNARRVSFERCTFTSATKKSIWVQAPKAWKPEEKYSFRDCRFVVRNTALPQGEFVGVLKGIRAKGNRFEFAAPGAKAKGYYFSDCCDAPNVDEGGNEVVYR